MQSIPANSSLVCENQVPALLSRFVELFELRSAPYAAKIVDERNADKIYWARSPRIGRAIPGGAMATDASSGLDYQATLEKFLATSGVEEVFAWGIGVEKSGVIRGQYSHAMRQWFRRDVIVTPTVAMSVNSDIAILINDDWGFSVVIGDEASIGRLEDTFGGEARLQDNFVGYVNRLNVGFGQEGKNWAEKYPVRWSGWL